MSEAAKVESLPQPPEPEVNADGIKIYPTSFIPAKAHMEPSRVPTAKMTGLQIEVLHVVIFFVLTIGLFISMWKKPNER
nr:hypothetical protein BHI3_22790 [Bacteriovorax sp. HI3]